MQQACLLEEIFYSKMKTLATHCPPTLSCIFWYSSPECVGGEKVRRTLVLTTGRYNTVSVED